MDYWRECLALGVDLLFLGFSIKEYSTYKRIISNFVAAPELDINSNLNALVAQQPNNKLPCAVIRGVVSPIGAPLRSIITPGITGVVQTMKVKEHYMRKIFGNLWLHRHNTIHKTFNEVPFELQNGNHAVEIDDVGSAAVLDMELVYNRYDPAKLSLLDHIVGFLTGIRYTGVQTSIEMLRDGAIITAIGELQLDGGILRLHNAVASPLCLTTATKSTLLLKLHDLEFASYKKVLIGSSLAFLLMGYISRNLYMRLKQLRMQQQRSNSLENERRTRRALARANDIADNEACVICQRYPKEIILLPCGHVCICEDCSMRLNTICPICRGQIERKVPAFIV